MDQNTPMHISTALAEQLRRSDNNARMLLAAVVVGPNADYGTPQFETLHKLATSLYSSYARLTGYQQAIALAAEVACTWMCSNFAVQDPQTYNGLTPDIQNSVRQNVQDFRNYSTTGQLPSPQQQQPHPQQHHHFQQPHPHHQQQRPQVPLPHGNSGHFSGMTTAPAPQANSGMYGKIANLTSSVASETTVDHTNRASAMANGYTAPRSMYGQETAARPNQVDATVDVSPPKEVRKESSRMEFNSVEEIDPVDYAQHKTHDLLFPARRPGDSKDINPGRARHALTEVINASSLSVQYQTRLEAEGISITDGEGSPADIEIDHSVILQDNGVILGINEDIWMAVARMLEGHVDLFKKSISVNTCVSDYMSQYSGDDDRFQKLMKLEDAKTLADLCDRFNEIYDDPIIPSSWNRMNDTLTEMVNEFIKIQMGLNGISIPSFAISGNELEEYISTKYDDLVDDLPHLFTLVKESLLRVRTTQSDDILAIDSAVDKNATVEIDGKEVPYYQGGFVMRYNVVLVPCFAKDLYFTYEGEAGSVYSSKNPLLYQAIENIFGNQNEVFAGTFIITRDGRALKLFRDIHNKDVFYIKAINRFN